jgi:hypothetical protein
VSPEFESLNSAQQGRTLVNAHQWLSVLIGAVAIAVLGLVLQLQVAACVYPFGC